MKKTIFLPGVLALTLCACSTGHQAPQPTVSENMEGWVYNEELSDEFEGNALDTTNGMTITRPGWAASLHSSGARM